MKRALAFILGAPTIRSTLWRIAYTLDFYCPKRLRGNRPTRNADVRAYRELQRAVRTDTDSP